MWNKEHAIKGYHVYDEGKPVSNKAYTVNVITKGSHPVTSQTTIDVIQQIERLYGKVMVIPRKGILVGSTAVAQLSETDTYLRVNVRVHPYDEVIVTKKRGRLIATQRMIKLVKWAADNKNFVDQAVAYGVSRNIMALIKRFEPKIAGPKDIWVMLRLATNEFEIVSGNELTDLEQRLMKVHATKA